MFRTTLKCLRIPGNGKLHMNDIVAKFLIVFSCSSQEKVSSLWQEEGLQIENESSVSVQNFLDGLSGKLKVITTTNAHSLHTFPAHTIRPLKNYPKHRLHHLLHIHLIM